MPNDTVKIDSQRWIELVGDKLGVPKVFRDAIFGIESAGGRPDIHDSTAGAMGPGQLMPATAKRLGVNPRNPAENIYGSLKLQKILLDKYRGETGGDEVKAWILAAAAYNSGEGNVAKHGGVPPFKETQDYVRKLAKHIRAAGGPEAIRASVGSSGSGSPLEVGGSASAGLRRLRPEKETVGIEPVEKERPPRPSVLPAMPTPRPQKTSVLAPVPKAAPRPVFERATAGVEGEVAHGFTPPSRQATATEGVLEAASRGLNKSDTTRSFLEGVAGAVGGTVADVGFLAQQAEKTDLPGHLMRKAAGRTAPQTNVLEDFGSSLQEKAAISAAGHEAPDTLGQVRQGVAHGAGAALVELPKLLVGSGTLGALNLPLKGGLSGYRTEGVPGLVKGAIGGAVFHYGGGVTGKFLGRVGNALFWTAAPAAEQHLLQGVPLAKAIGENLPLGVYQGLGSQASRARIRTAGGKVREARPTDLPKIFSKKVELLEPEQFVGYGAYQAAKKRLSGGEGGFAALRKGDAEQVGKLNRIPNGLLPDLVTLGAFHYEAGTRTYEDWMGRMLPEIGETQDSIKPEVAKQLGEVWARSKQLYDGSTAPVFFSGLRQTIKELAAQNLIGGKVRPERLLNLLKQRGQGEELKASGLEKELSSKKEPFSVDDLTSWLDLQGMTMDVLKGGVSSTPSSGYDLIVNQAGGKNTLPGVATRASVVSEGGRNYFEGVVHSNKAMDFSADDVHMGVRPDQISWYRAQLLGGEAVEARNYSIVEDSVGHFNLVDDSGTPVKGPFDTRDKAELYSELYAKQGFESTAILEEIQSKRNSLARRHGVTEDPENYHSKLVAAQREIEILDSKARELEVKLGMTRWEPTTEYDRYTPLEDTPEDLRDYPELWSGDPQQVRDDLLELDRLRAQINQLDSELLGLEHRTDSSPVPWAPHLDTWYEPALKGFLRDAAERLEPDQDGNIKVTWTPASEQLGRYPSARKLVTSIKAVPSWIPGDRPDGPARYDVTYSFKVGPNPHSVKQHNLTLQEVRTAFGDGAAESIAAGETSINFKTAVPVGGEWAIKLYGDTENRIYELYPQKRDLLKYAWKAEGNKAVVPAWLEKYGKAWGATVELAVPTNIYDKNYQYSIPAVPHLIIPEQMRQALLKKGQLFFGRRLPELPKGQGYGLRNRITPTEAAEAAREIVARRFTKAQNALTGDRVPSPESDEGGFLRLGKKKPELDQRVQTDVNERGRDTAGVGVFFRSPSRWMAGFKDARIDGVAERIFDAEVREHDYTTEWGRRLSAIVDHLKMATLGTSKVPKVFGRKAADAQLKQTFTEFVDLIEKPLEIEDDTGSWIDNPGRRSRNPLIQRALEEHDALSKDFKDYLIQSYQARGIEIADPDNWGITQQGYFRHLFPGEDNIFMDGDYQGTAETYLDAVVKANDLISANPTAQVEIRRRPIQFVDPSLRVSTNSFERLVSKLTGDINNGQQIITGGEVRQDLMGTVGKRENIAKFFAAALKREGYEGYLKDYEYVMRAHLFQLARSQELSKLRKDVTPVLEELNREGQKGVVEGIERHLNDLWGRPLEYEKRIGGLIRAVPALRERIANPDLGAEIIVRRIAAFHNIAKLRYNPKAMFVNRIQPLRTLWPYLTTKDFLSVIKKYRDPRWQQDMTDLGVMMGAVKLETGGSRVEGFGAREFLKDPFTYVSGSNRALGYTAGVIFAEREGLNGYDAHKMGMKWAAKVEFDNSKWDAPRFLRHSAGQLFGQYKGFLIKDIENTVEIFSRQQGDTGLGSKASRVGKWFIGTATFGGIKAGLSPMSWLGTAAGYSLYLQGAAMIAALTGVSDKDAKFYASMAFLGAPAAMGLDISSSVTPIDDPPGITAWEKVGRFAAGPTVTGAYDIGRSAKQVVDPGAQERRLLGERLINVGAKISPYVRSVQRGFQLEQDVVRGRTQYLSLDQHRVPLTRTQELFGALGVPPANQSLYYEVKEATGKSPYSSGPPQSLFGNPKSGLLNKRFTPMPTRRKGT